MDMLGRPKIMAWLAALLSLFCFSLPFTKLFYLPKIAYKLQYQWGLRYTTKQIEAEKTS
jgi:hypothetical protein